MAKYLFFSIGIFITSLVGRTIREKFFIDIKEEDNKFVYGLLKTIGNDQLPCAIHYQPNIAINESNLLCGKMNYDSLHSFISPCKINKSSISIDYQSDNVQSCKKYKNYFFFCNRYVCLIIFLKTNIRKNEQEHCWFMHQMFKKK